MNEASPERAGEEQGERPPGKRSVTEVLVALRRAANGLEANLREAARLLRRAGTSGRNAA